MKTWFKAMLMTAVAFALIGHIGCSKEEGPMEKTGRKIDEAAEKTGEAVKEGAEKTEEAAKEAAEKAKEATE